MTGCKKIRAFCRTRPPASAIAWAAASRFLRIRRSPLKAAISFYGGGIVPALLPRAAQQHAPILFFWGALDSHIPKEHIRAIIDAMQEAKKTYVNVEFSDADHAFFCDARPSYKETAAKQAWELALKFLATYVR